jgi:ATP-dependent DNA ligase
LYQNSIELMHGLMRLLSPEEIRELTTDSQGEHRLSLTEMMMKEEGASMAKVLPFAPPNAPEVPEAASVVAVDGQPVAAPVPPAEGQAQVEAAPKEEVPQEGALNATLLILQVKQRLKNTQEKLKEKEVLGLYRKSMAIDINQERLNRNDLKKSSNLGVLVNKKQA